ncbi:MAG: uracil-DNA glycosylase family protein [Thaumarchaeota archaeon]|nr:uracil-DNA glycosylase family protein [Nitrososphaerota archaeon]
MSSNEAKVRAEVDKVFATNPQLFDHRKKYPWCPGYLGDMTSGLIFLAENPSLQGLRKVSKNEALQDPELQWWVSRGDKVFRSALAKAGFKDGRPDERGGWHCYITNFVKMAEQPSRWNSKTEEERFEIVRAFAPVLQTEINIVKPRMIAVMGMDRPRSYFLRVLHEHLLELPPSCAVEYVWHYATFNRGSFTTAKVHKYETDFERLSSKLRQLGRG